MNFKRAKSAAPFVVKILDNQLGQTRVVGTREPLQQMSSLDRIEICRGQPIKRRVSESVQIAVPAQRFASERLAADEFAIKRRGKIGLLIEQLALMIEMQVQFPPQVLQRTLRVLIVCQ